MTLFVFSLNLTEDSFLNKTQLYAHYSEILKIKDVVLIILDLTVIVILLPCLLQIF